MRLLLVIALLQSGAPGAASGQGPIEFLRLDRLQVSSVGITAGAMRASQVNPTTVYGVTADYGEIAAAWRVKFGISFWSSHYEDEVVQTFVDSLQRSVNDPSGKARITPSPVSLYDVTFSMGMQRVLHPRSWWTPTFSVGMAAHVLNAEGRLIKGTFVERALDDVAAGFYTTAGVQARAFGRIELEGAVRGDLLSGYRSMQFRTGLSYRFAEPSRPSPSGGSTTPPSR